MASGAGRVARITPGSSCTGLTVRPPSSGRSWRLPSPPGRRVGADPRGAGPRSERPEALTGPGNPQQTIGTGQYPDHGEQAVGYPGASGANRVARATLGICCADLMSHAPRIYPFFALTLLSWLWHCSRHPCLAAPRLSRTARWR